MFNGTVPHVSPQIEVHPRVVVVIPCHNEALSVTKVVHDFLAQAAVAEVVVVDNNSTDQTAALAAAAGARVVSEPKQGKGHALLSGLREAGDAEYFVMVDGDDTYPAEELGALLSVARSGADMVNATRLQHAEEGSLRAGHGFGNQLFIALARLLFRLKTKDLFSGYRVLSRRFVDTVPLVARGFEVELELSLQAQTRGFRVAEVAVPYRARQKGSASKLRTYRDGARILKALVLFFRDYRPMLFFGTASLVLLTLSLLGGSVVIAEFLRSGQVPRLPLAVLSAALFLMAALMFASGVLLSSINRRATEITTLIAKVTGRRSK